MSQAGGRGPGKGGRRPPERRKGRWWGFTAAVATFPGIPACFAVGPRGPASSDGEPPVLDAAKSAVEVDVVTGSRDLEGRGV